MSYKLERPYTKEQRLDFIVQYNHNQGLRIEETDTALYALEPWEKLVDGEVIDNTEEYEAEQIQKERERISMLSLTAADVERAIYKARGMDFDDILELVKNNPEIDSKALKIELKANNFYRGNPYIDTIGIMLGYSMEDLDNLFKTGSLPEKVEEPIVEEEI